MLGNTYDGQNCSAARALEFVGERWSLLIIRDALFAGATRFSDFLALGLARNILAARLDSFVESGLMERGPGGEYLLTEKGRDLSPVVVALSYWGDRWAAPNGAPIIYQHDGCGGDVEQPLLCTACRRTLRPGDVGVRPGPSF